MNQEQLKGMLGSRYQYRRILTSGEVLHLQKENPPWFTGQIAASPHRRLCPAGRSAFP